MPSCRAIRGKIGSIKSSLHNVTQILNAIDSGDPRAAELWLHLV